MANENQGSGVNFVSPVSNEKAFWIAGKSQWNRWQVRSASVDDLEEYTLIEDLGPVRKKDPDTGEWYEPIKDVGIEFDGEFALERSGTVVLLHTVANPWLCVLMTDARLFVKRAGIPAQEQEPVQLATNVISASICRGWVNYATDSDMGLVVAYVLDDGTVWYRVRTQVSSEFVWDEPIQLAAAGSSGVHVKCFRLNDYRIAIYVRGQSGDRLFISKRKYIGNTVKDEYVETEFFDPDFLVFSNRDLEIEDGSILEPVNVTLVDLSNVDVEFNFPVFDYDSSWEDITWAGTRPAGQAIESLRFEGTHLLIKLKIPMPARTMELKFQCREHNRKGYYVSDQAKPIWPALTILKEQEVLSETVNQGSVAAGLQSSVVQFNSVQAQNLVATPEESVLGTLVSVVSFSNIQILDIKVRPEESVSTNLDSAVVQFINQQTGDVPV